MDEVWSWVWVIGFAVIGDGVSGLAIGRAWRVLLLLLLMVFAFFFGVVKDAPVRVVEWYLVAPVVGAAVGVVRKRVAG